MKNKQKIKIDKIPSVFKNISFPKEVYISPKILAGEGTILLVEAGNHEGKLNTLDFTNGRLGKLWQWDKIPAVLGYRKATTEFAGFVPSSITVGDELYLLCESGVIGEISGVFESWGRPMKVKVLGSILDKNGKCMNLKNFSLPPIKKIRTSIPLIVFLGTRMDSGKTTIACKIAHEFKAMGKKIAALKLTGVAFSQDLMRLTDSGVSLAFDFTDMGLPSTCNGSSSEIVNSALNLVAYTHREKPDFILVEFGDAVLGEYHVADILKNKIFKSQISVVILAANDLAGVKGTKDILAQWGIEIDIVTGPIANSKIGIDLIHKHFNIVGESNQHNIPKTISLIRSRLFQ
ncbi:hypothetical protein FJY90_03660 [Candidatus Gottesmanbacteria bacterium]|nr:hypothetical protein [Candidatus Gottesmanbacteria bacterium]